MATVLETDATLDTSNFEEGIEKMKEGMDDAKKKAKETSEESKKDWGALGELFQDFLPRNLQRTIRSFKMTQRSVRNAGRSFKVLRGAIISTGIGALIVGLTELIDKWDQVSDWLGITSQAQRDHEEAVRKTNEAVTEQSILLGNQVQILEDVNVPLEEREAVLAQMARTVQGLTDLDLEQEGAIDRVTAAVQRQNALLETETMLKEKKRALQDRLQEQAEQAEHWTQIGMSSAGKQADMEKRANEYAEENIVPLQEEINQLMRDQATILADLATEAEAAAEARAKAAEEEREAAAAEAQRLRDLEQARRDRENQRKVDAEAIAETEMFMAQRNMTRLELELDNLRRRKEADEERVESQEALIAVRAKYDELERQIYEREEEQRGKQEQDDAQALLKAQQDLEDAFFMQQQDEFERREVEAMRQFEQRIAIAEGNAELELQVEQEFQEAMAAIEADRIQAGLDAEEEAREKTRRANEEDLADANRLFAERAAAYTATADAVVGLSTLMTESGEEAKALAITQVALDQAMAVAAAIRGASQASAAGGPLAPFIIAGYIASMVGAVVSGFKQVQSLMQSADAPQPEMAQDVSPRTLVPTVGFNPFQQQQAPTLNSRSYLVQSDLQGAMMEYERTQSFATL